MLHDIPSANQRPPLSGTATSLVVIAHGWGADGANLIDVADMLADHVPGAYFIAPDAPEVCEVNPFGFQWFSLMDRREDVMFAGARRAEAQFNALVDAQLSALELSAERLALVGFSQGTMLSLHVGLRRAKAPACVVGFSGALLGAGTLHREIVSHPPVCLIHGAQDEVVPFAAMSAAEAALKENHVPVETHARPYLGHSIDMEGIQTAGAFLRKYLGA